MSVPGPKRYAATQNKETPSGNDVMAELQAILRGRRTPTDKGLTSLRGQKITATREKSTSASEKRFNSTENIPTASREADSPLSPTSTKWHVAPPKRHQPPISKGSSTMNETGTTAVRRPINPPLKTSPIPIPGSGSGLIPDPGLPASDVTESSHKRHKALAFTNSAGADVSTFIAGGNQAASNSSPSGQKAAFTQSLPKSNVNRIGPPPNAPPPRLTHHSNTASPSLPSSSITSVQSANKSSSKTVGAGRTSKQTSPYPPKLSTKTSNITFNEPVKVTKKGKKAPLVTSKSSSSVGIKRLLFKKKGNKKSSPVISAPLAGSGSTSSGGSGFSEPTHPKKIKTETKFRSRPTSPEEVPDFVSENKYPVSSSIPTSTSTPAFGYQNVFEDEVFLRKNRHRIEEIPVDKKPKPLPRKSSVSNILGPSSRQSALEPYEMAALIREEEVIVSGDSGSESPSYGRRKRTHQNDDSPVNFQIVGSPEQQSTNLARSVPVGRESPLSPPSSKSRPQSTASLTKVVSPTGKGQGQVSSKFTSSPEAKQQNTTDAFQPVTKVGSRVDLFSDLTKFPLFHPDPGLSTITNQEIDNTMETNSSAKQKSSDARLGQRLPEDDYIAMDSLRVSANMSLLEVSNEENFPMDPRSSGYYLKIIAPTETSESKKKKHDGDGDQELCPDSPDAYDEVNLRGIVAVPVVVSEPIMSPENEYVAIDRDRSRSPRLLSDSEEGRQETDVGAADRLVRNNDKRRTPSPTKQFRCISEQRQARISPSPEPAVTDAEQRRRPGDSRMLIRDGPSNLKYSDVTINPVSSTANVVKRKPSAPKKFSYQMVQLELGKKNTIEEGDIREATSSSYVGNKRDSQDGTFKFKKEGVESQSMTERERKTSQGTGVQSRVATSRREQEESQIDTLPRLADRPLPKVPKKEKQQHQQEIDETVNDTLPWLADRPLPKVPKKEKQQHQQEIDETVDESIIYEDESSIGGQSASKPLCVSIPAKTPAGRVVWHEYVEIDEQEIEKMGGALPPLPPGQLLRLLPLIRNGQQSDDDTGTVDSEVKWNVPYFDDFADDVSDTCSIYRSDSVDSCPYIEPPEIGIPPVVPYRPDNLDEMFEQKSLQSGDYSYAAVPGKSVGVKWMRFQSSDPRHIRLAPLSSRDDSQGYILATPEAVFASDSDDSGSGTFKMGNAKQSKSGGDSDGKRDPPIIPPKTASLLREQRLFPTAGTRPQSYLIPVITNQISGGVQGGDSTRDKSKSTSHLSSNSDAIDAATGERMKRHRGEPPKSKPGPPPKPKPYKDVMKQQATSQGQQKGLEVVLVDERNMPYNRDRVKSSVTRKFGAVPGGATLGQTLWREKSQSTGNLLETSNDFDTREKWIEGNSKLDTKASVAPTASRVSQKMSQLPVVQNQERSKPSKQSHKPLRMDAVKRKSTKSSDESIGSEIESPDQRKAINPRSLALMRQNRDRIVKHLSRALDTEELQLNFGQDDGEMESGRKTSPRSEAARGLGEILSELDVLLKNNVCSREDLLLAIQSRLDLKLNTQQRESSPQEKEEQPTENTASHTAQESPTHELQSKRLSGGASSKADTREETSNQQDNKKSGMSSKAHYVNEEILPRLKSLKMETYVPPYANHVYLSESEDSAPNSQSSEQSSSSGNSETRSSRYENLDNWIDAANNKAKKSKSDSSTENQATFESNTDTSTEEGIGLDSVIDRSRKTSAPVRSTRLRSQSSIDVSPKSRKKKFSIPASSELKNETDSTLSRGYQLALQMEDERLYNTRGFRRGPGLAGSEAGTQDRSRRGHAAAAPSTYGQSSNGQSTGSVQRSSTGQAPFDSAPMPSDASSVESSSQTSPNRSRQFRAARSPLPSESSRDNGGKQTGSSSTTAGPQQSSSIREGRSFTVGSFHSRRRPFTSSENDANGGQSTFMNGVGVFTNRGGVLMNAGSGVVIEVPEDAIPRGRKQKLWFEVIQDVFNPLQEEEMEASHGHPFTDSFQFHTGSAEFENYLAGKRERKVQLSPVIQIGPSDATLSRPIKIKMPHCLPYQNNSWHLHMLAKAQGSESQDWTELSNTIGLIELPPKRTGNKTYRKSSYQMHIDYTQVSKTIFKSLHYPPILW